MYFNCLPMVKQIYRKLSPGFSSLVTFPNTNLTESANSSPASHANSSQKLTRFLLLQPGREALALYQLQEPTP